MVRGRTQSRIESYRRQQAPRRCLSSRPGRLKKRRIVRLRYAPHILGSASASPEQDARGAINIIVNERVRPKSKSRKSFSSTSGKAHKKKAFSVDSKSLHRGDSQLMSARPNTGTSRAGDRIVRLRQRQRVHFQSQPYSERSFEQSKSSCGGLQSFSSNPEYHTGYFRRYSNEGRKQSQSQIVYGDRQNALRRTN